MHLSIATLRTGLPAVSRKLAFEALVSGAATLLVMAILSHIAKPSDSLALGERPSAAVEEKRAADAANSAIKDFMVRVALSALSGDAKIEPVAAVAESAEPDAAAPRAAIPLQPRRPASAKPRARILRPISRLPLAPPARPQLTVAAAAPVAAPARALSPVEHVARLSSALWESTSGAGAFVVDNVGSARDRLGAVAKGLM